MKKERRKITMGRAGGFSGIKNVPRTTNNSLLIERKTRTENIPPGYTAVGRWSGKW